MDVAQPEAQAHDLAGGHLSLGYMEASSYQVSEAIRPLWKRGLPYWPHFT